ncbi:hypothetical protein MUCCIDRAFT_113668 [Mucor lusitanicus CBS 277.49]|uniref:Uncharacterized protein n=1 Tax=Mucor lusitanicus CBS 277.49 TaxID=747725 RepID=A0A168IPZ5_MUCCL|nr:hypothetical protein MUCCIDRAFT_113668 [Mucor lusitanicus CBS 277.49]
MQSRKRDQDETNVSDEEKGEGQDDGDDQEEESGTQENVVKESFFQRRHYKLKQKEQRTKH